MSPNNYSESERVSEINSGARLAALRDELLQLIKDKSLKATYVAKNYCSLTELSDDLESYAEGQYLLAQSLMIGSDLHSALAAAIRASGIFRSLENSLSQAEVDSLSGKINLNLGNLDSAERDLRCAINITKGHSDRGHALLYGKSLNQLAGVQIKKGGPGEALLSLETALKVFKSQKDYVSIINCLTNIGYIHNTLGQYHLAISSLVEAYEINKTIAGEITSGGYILANLANTHYLNKNHGLALEVGKSALLIAFNENDSMLIASTLLNLGTFSVDNGDYEAAERYLIDSLKKSSDIGYSSVKLAALDSMGLLYQRTKRLSDANTAYHNALAIALELEDAQGELDARLHLGTVELTLGNLDAAQDQLTRSLALAAENESPKEEAEAHRLLADLAQRQGDYRRAFEHSQEHLRIKDELFNTERDRQTRNLSIQFEVERARHDADVYRVRTEVEQEARLAAEQLVQERTADLARAQHEVVTRLAMAAEYRDDTTGEHTRRVGRTAARIARALGWSEDRAKILGIAARLHDVGKIGIPDSILLKPGKLTDAEFEQMKTHTLIGSRILSGGRSELLRLAEEIALSHHERWDGSGYPCGLRGEEVPLTGRIVALADVFDALTQARPYKRAWTPEEALAELKTEAGSHFDPLIVETALRVLTPAAANSSAGLSLLPDDVMLDEEDASHILSVFEQLLVERTRDLEEARASAEQAAQEMERMAFTDSLTGLPNRRAFEADLEAVFGQEGATPSVVSFDLDGLKATNDTLGHGLGDALLQRFAGSLEHHFAGVGRAYRIGGDEFAVIGIRPHGDEALTALLQAVLEAAHARGQPQPSASMGVARAPSDAQTPGDLLRESDRRMYLQKVSRRAGR